MKTLRKIVNEATDGKGVFLISETGRHATIQYARQEVDIVDGVLKEQRGRKWLISQFMTEAEIHRTMLLAIEVYERHELYERFKVNGRRLLSPHPEGMRVEGKVTWETMF